MVAAGPVTPFSTQLSAAGGSGGPAQESARIKAEILSARSEKQCTNCEGDKEKLDQKIRELEAKLRRVESATNASAPREADPSRPSDGAVKALEAVAEAKHAAAPGALSQDPEPNDRPNHGQAANRGNSPGRIVDVIV